MREAREYNEKIRDQKREIRKDRRDILYMDKTVTDGIVTVIMIMTDF